MPQNYRYDPKQEDQPADTSDAPIFDTEGATYEEILREYYGETR